jgi:hypothetical protein
MGRTKILYNAVTAVDDHRTFAPPPATKVIFFTSRIPRLPGPLPLQPNAREAGPPAGSCCLASGRAMEKVPFGLPILPLPSTT